MQDWPWERPVPGGENESRGGQTLQASVVMRVQGRVGSPEGVAGERLGMGVGKGI